MKSNNQAMDRSSSVLKDQTCCCCSLQVGLTIGLILVCSVNTSFAGFNPITMLQNTCAVFAIILVWIEKGRYLVLTKVLLFINLCLAFMQSVIFILSTRGQRQFEKPELKSCYVGTIILFSVVFSPFIAFHISMIVKISKAKTAMNAAKLQITASVPV